MSEQASVLLIDVNENKTPITERALLRRINRKSAKQSERLRRCRENARFADSLGTYYLIDYMSNFVVATHVDIEALGRELGVLHDQETVSE